MQSAYTEASTLFYAGGGIQSEEGVQQGDPLGPVLFCMAVQPLLSEAQVDLRIGYLDDLTFGDSLPKLADALIALQDSASDVGLKLNINKCELITSASAVIPPSLACIKRVDPSIATLLGSPLQSSTAMREELERQVSRLQVATERLKYLQSHDAMVILRHSMSMPKLLYTLRSSCCVGQPALADFDNQLRSCLSQLLNVSLDDQQWAQASLPVGDGGFGIRSATHLAPSAYLASASGSTALVSIIIPSSYAVTVIQMILLKTINFGG